MEIEIHSIPELPPSNECEEIRKAAGLTVTQLGAAVGVSAASIRQWEAGMREPRGLGRIAYAQALAQLKSEALGSGE